MNFCQSVNAVTVCCRRRMAVRCFFAAIIPTKSLQLAQGSPGEVVYALEFFPAHEPKVLFFLSHALTKMVHAPRTTRYLDSLSRHRILRWAIHCWPRRPSNHHGRIRLYVCQFRQRADKYSGRGSRRRGAYRKGPGVFVDVEHILEENQETPSNWCCSSYPCSEQCPHLHSE
jgi:hypothetical protein